MNIHVVFGSTGEYSDRTEWPVVAYTQELDAQSHVAAATAKAREIEAAIQSYHGEDWDYEKNLCKTNQFDPQMQMDYTGTHYYMVTVELKESR